MDEFFLQKVEFDIEKCWIWYVNNWIWSENYWIWSEKNWIWYAKDWIWSQKYWIWYINNWIWSENHWIQHFKGWIWFGNGWIQKIKSVINLITSTFESKSKRAKVEEPQYRKFQWHLAKCFRTSEARGRNLMPPHLSHSVAHPHCLHFHLSVKSKRHIVCMQLKCTRNCTRACTQHLHYNKSTL